MFLSLEGFISYQVFKRGSDGQDVLVEQTPYYSNLVVFLYRYPS